MNTDNWIGGRETFKGKVMMFLRTHFLWLYHIILVRDAAKLLEDWEEVKYNTEPTLEDRVENLENRNKAADMLEPIINMDDVMNELQKDYKEEEQKENDL
jgi:hypothetical protein